MSENRSRIERAVLSRVASRTLAAVETALYGLQNGTLSASKRNFSSKIFGYFKLKVYFCSTITVIIIMTIIIFSHEVL